MLIPLGVPSLQMREVVIMSGMALLKVMMAHVAEYDD
jgi:hypothetical protein